MSDTSDYPFAAEDAAFIAAVERIIPTMATFPAPDITFEAEVEHDARIARIIRDGEELRQRNAAAGITFPFPPGAEIRPEIVTTPADRIVRVATPAAATVYRNVPRVVYDAATNTIAVDMEANMPPMEGYLQPAEPPPPALGEWERPTVRYIRPDPVDVELQGPPEELLPVPIPILDPDPASPWRRSRYESMPIKKKPKGLSKKDKITRESMYDVLHRLVFKNKEGPELDAAKREFAISGRWRTPYAKRAYAALLSDPGGKPIIEADIRDFTEDVINRSYRMRSLFGTQELLDYVDEEIHDHVDNGTGECSRARLSRHMDVWFFKDTGHAMLTFEGSCFAQDPTVLFENFWEMKVFLDNMFTRNVRIHSIGNINTIVDGKLQPLRRTGFNKRVQPENMMAKILSNSTSKELIFFPADTRDIYKEFALLEFNKDAETLTHLRMTPSLGNAEKIHDIPYLVYRDRHFWDAIVNKTTATPSSTNLTIL